jgi:hypothetical protein
MEPGPVAESWILSADLSEGSALRTLLQQHCPLVLVRAIYLIVYSKLHASALNGAVEEPARSVCPRVKEQNPCGLEIRGVPGHDTEAVAQGGGSDQSVRGVYGSPRFFGGGCEFSPDAARFEIDGEEPIGVVAFEGLQPVLKRALLPLALRRAMPLKSPMDITLTKRFSSSRPSTAWRTPGCPLGRRTSDST